jgi:hypothetical protein
MKLNSRSTSWMTYALLAAGVGHLDVDRMAAQALPNNLCAAGVQQASAPESSFTLAGLSDPATVSGAISVSAINVVAGQQVIYCLDKKAIWTASNSPYSLGPLNQYGAPDFSIRDLAPGHYVLEARSLGPDKTVRVSNSITLNVVEASVPGLSTALKPYPLQPGLQQPISKLLASLSTAGAGLSSEEEDARTQIAAMYRNFGFDLAADNSNDLSEELPKLSPTGWSAPSGDAKLPLSMRFSEDSPFYQPIPKTWPRVRLPRHLMQTVQLNTNQQGDGIGYGVAVAEDDAPVRTVTAMWENQPSTRTATSFSISPDWKRHIPSLPAGDRHVIFIDPKQAKFISLYKVSSDPSTGSPHGLYAAPPTSFNSLGDHGGSAAARFAELPLLIQPGEATDDLEDIHHAIGGPISRVWAARVYPATARDYGVLESVNTCTNKGKMNTGVVPYGGIIQLDPALDLDQLHLTRPARRILRAMQVYGYYVMDFGCADLDIYTAVPEKEFDGYGGLYGFHPNGPGVQNEIAKVIRESDLYVVPPVTKRP